MHTHMPAYNRNHSRNHSRNHNHNRRRSCSRRRRRSSSPSALRKLHAARALRVRPTQAGGPGASSFELLVTGHSLGGGLATLCVPAHAPPCTA